MSFGPIVRIAQVPLLPATIPSDWRPDARGRHDPQPHARRRDTAVNEVQGTLGEALLLLGSLAAVLFAVILLLLEAKVIVRLGSQLHRDLRFAAPPPAGRLPAGRERPVPESGPEERRDDAAR
jgi:hypothetical protein